MRPAHCAADRRSVEQLGHIAPLDGADRPVIPGRAKFRIDPVHVLLPGLFLLPAVTLDDLADATALTLRVAPLHGFAAGSVDAAAIALTLEGSAR
jgi:hypothetical protein